MKSKRRKATIRIVARLILIVLAVLLIGAVAVKASPAEVNEPTIYDVPLSDDLQLYIAELCEGHHIDPEIVLGIIEKESGFDPKVVGDQGRSVGLMQIQPRWHKDRMEYLGCLNLTDPYANVTVGIDIFAELMAEYQDTEKALMVYNAGATGAANNWFQFGVYSNEYSQSVLKNAANLKPKEVKEEMNPVPDNYDVWFENERKKEEALKRLPICGICGFPIQQETAFRGADHVLYCDDCFQYNRVEVVVE